MSVIYYCVDRFGQRVAEDKSVAGLARKVGVSPATVHKWIDRFQQGQPSRYGFVEEEDNKTVMAGRCKYCECKTAKYTTVCSACKAKLDLVRKLIAIGNLIKEDAKNESPQS